MFMQGDTVRYCGKTLQERHSLTKDKVGEVVAFVLNQRNALVVDFGGDVFICDAKNLTKHSYSAGIGPEVDRIVRKWSTPDDEKKARKPEKGASK
jgi:hypothetical protein